MRQLSTLEKEVIKILVEWEETLKTQPHNPYMMTFEGLLNHVIFKKCNGEVTVRYNIQLLVLDFEAVDDIDLNAIKINNQMTRDFINIVNFLDYLSKNEFIYFIFSSNSIWARIPFSLGNITRTGISITNINTMHDQSFIEKVKGFYGKDVFCTQTLIDYYNNGYKTDEEVRHKESIDAAQESLKQAQESLKIGEESLTETRKGLKLSEDSLKESQNNLKIAKWALWVTVGFGIVSIFFSAYQSWKGSENPDIKIDKIQFETINKQLKKIESIENRLDQMIDLNDKKKKDTALLRIKK